MTFDEFAWLGRRVAIVALIVGEFWSGSPIRERVAVYALLLGVVLLGGWVRDVRRRAAA